MNKEIAIAKEKIFAKFNKHKLFEEIYLKLNKNNNKINNLYNLIGEYSLFFEKFENSIEIDLPIKFYEGFMMKILQIILIIF